jgi:RHS repeat-associated protein
LVAEVDAAGSVVKSYGYRPGLTWTTFIKVGGQYYFYQNDHLGTPQKLTAVNGAVVWLAKYFSFGEADVDFSSSVTNNLRYAGQYFDEEFGLHYNLRRYYYPKTGRYLTSNHIGLAGGINLYPYVLNNPMKYVDPKGEIAFLLGLGIVAGVVTVITTTIYFIISKPEWEVNEKIIESLNVALKMQKELEKRERDPCITSEQKREIEKLKLENFERIRHLLKMIHDKGLDIGKDFMEYQYFSHMKV